MPRGQRRRTQVHGFVVIHVRVTKCRRLIEYQLSDIYMTAVDGRFDLF